MSIHGILLFRMIFFPEYDEDQAYAHTIEGDMGEEREAAYRDDPLKALSHFFDREGFDMEFSFSESGTAHNHKWTCYIEFVFDSLSLFLFLIFALKSFRWGFYASQRKKKSEQYEDYFLKKMR